MLENLRMILKNLAAIILMIDCEKKVSSLDLQYLFLTTGIGCIAWTEPVPAAP